LGNAAGDASFAYGWASMLNAAVTASGGEQYSSQATVGVSIIVIIIWSLLNCFRVDQLGWINNMAAFIQLSSVVFIVFALLCIPKTLNPSSFVFTQYHNETGFGDSSYVICIGILFSLFSFTGFEASAHMAEGNIVHLIIFFFNMHTYVAYTVQVYVIMYVLVQ
jgi:amino acid transporter